LSLLLTVGAAFTGYAANAPASIRLFGMPEIRGKLHNFSRWDRILEAEQHSPTFGRDLHHYMNPTDAAQWKVMTKHLSNASVVEKAHAVNNFFNRWPYRQDMEIYGVETYWPTPAEFLLNSGMCHGYAITKFYALINLGVPQCDMRIVVLKDTTYDISKIHAVLVVYENDTAYILCNMDNDIITHCILTSVMPKFSVNKAFLWRHGRPIQRDSIVTAQNFSEDL
jgi:predicted transglutaminase-like cysteine proteinase